MTRRIAVLVGMLALVVGSAVPAYGHRDDYIDETLVYLTLAHGEFEPEYWFDYLYFSKADHFLRHHFSTEYGITDHAMVEARATIAQPTIGNGRFDSARLEFRRRLAEEGSRPIDLALSGEVNAERAEDGVLHAGFEPRLIFSRDLHQRVNLTLNLAEEISTRRSFEPAAGVRFEVNDRFNVGSEVRYSQGESNGVAIPQVWLKLPPHTTIKTGLFAGFGMRHITGGRIAFEFEF